MTRIVFLAALSAWAITSTASAAVSTQAKSARACQQEIASQTRLLLNAKLKALKICSASAWKCLAASRSPERCRSGATTRCATALGTVAEKRAAGIAKLVAACANAPLCSTDGPSGLGLQTIAPECAAQFDIEITGSSSACVIDVGNVAECLARHVGCQTDKLAELEEPRLHELLQSIAIDPDAREDLTCLGDHGGDGAVKSADSVTRVAKCSKAMFAHGRRFVDKTVAALTTCLVKINACSVAKDENACLRKAGAKCRSLIVKMDGERTKVRAAVTEECGPNTIAFDELLEPDAGNRSSTRCECGSIDLPTLSNSADVGRCLTQQHECRAVGVIALAFPRGEELLERVELELNQIACRRDPATLQASASIVSRQSLGPFGPLRKTVRSVVRTLGNANPSGPKPSYRNFGGFGGLGKKAVTGVVARRVALPGTSSRFIVRYSKPTTGFAATDGTAANIAMLRVQAREIDGSLLPDFWEVPIEIPAGETDGESRLVVTYPPDFSGCDVNLEFMVADSDVEGSLPTTIAQDQAPLSPGKVLKLQEVEQEQVAGVLGLGGVRWVTVSHDGRSVYVVGASERIGTCTVTGPGQADPDTPFCSANADCGTPGVCVKIAKATRDGVLAFERTAGSGSLAFVEAKFGGTLTGGCGLANAFFVSVSPDDRHVYVAGRGKSAISVYERGARGSLTLLQEIYDGRICALGPPTGSGCAADDATCICTTTETRCVACSGPAPCVDGLNEVRGIVFSPDGRNAYAVGGSDSAVAVFRRDTDTGLLSFLEVQKHNQGGVVGLLNAAAVAVSPDQGKHVYVASFGNNGVGGTVAVFARDATFGTLNFLGTTGELGAARDVALSPDGNNVYVVSGGAEDKLFVFARNPTTGLLSQVESHANGLGGLLEFEPLASIVSPDGSHVFVAGGAGSAADDLVSERDRTVAVFRRDAATGRLTFLPDAGGGHASEGVSVATDALGESLYATGERFDTIAVFRILSTP